MLVGSTERLENSTSSNRIPGRLSTSFNAAHGMSRSSGPLSYGFQSLEASIEAQDIQGESPPSIASIKTEILDTSSDTPTEVTPKNFNIDLVEVEKKVVDNSTCKKL